MENKKKYDYLIVPCPGDPIFREDKVEFSDLEDDKNNPGIKLYLGAGDRMKAAVTEAADATNVILVGGSESKVTAMYIFFKKEMSNPINKKVPEPICLVSKPDSTGNLAAVRIYLENNKNNKSGRKLKLAIISNNYHLPRLKLVWESILPDKKLIPVAAEKVLKKGAKERLYNKELKHRKVCEEAGCRDWENKQYDNQEKIDPFELKYWKCKKIDLNFKIINLSPKNQK